MLRYSLGSLFLALLYLSVACAALVNANGVWPQVAVTLTVTILLFFSLAAVFGGERWRVFAIAFSATGWLYLLLVFSNVTNIRPYLLSETVTNQLYQTMHASPAGQSTGQWLALGNAPGQQVVYVSPTPRPATQSLVTSGTLLPSLTPPPLQAAPVAGYAPAITPLATPAAPTVHPTPFANIAHSLWAVIVAFVGGTIGQTLHWRSHRREPAAETEKP